jgi:hypothetical protein
MAIARSFGVRDVLHQRAGQRGGINAVPLPPIE